MDSQDFKSLATTLRIGCLRWISRLGKGNAAGCMAIMDLLTFLYLGEIDGAPVLKYDVTKPHSETRDYVVLSEWDLAPALYAVLAQAGFIEKSETATELFPNRKIPGVEASLDSFGHGLSYANGIALALKMDRKPNRVYAVIGDEELQAGQTWEAALTASHHKLDNVFLIVHNDRTQHSGLTRGIKGVDNDSITQKFLSFGWNVFHIRNGHDMGQLTDGIKRAWRTRSRPTLIVCDTVLGKGIPFAEANPGYHGVAFSPEETRAALTALENGLPTV